jgi:tRNA modification GTPase
VSRRPTIAGVATGTPDGGVAIVRVSGPATSDIAARVLGDVPPARRLSVRALALADSEREQALVAFMPGPGSFTGEDVLELHVHAGEANVRAVMDAVLRAGAVAAGPGDFSRRAFELGRLGLDEAEGLAAIIGARTDAALAQARRLAGGELGREVEAVRERVLDLRAEIEANLDFPEDVDPGDVDRWRAEASALHEAIAAWLRRFEAGRRARERARVVLAGPPNAGKSSLFNALLHEARAIVADTPGTTRDYVEATLSIGPWAATLVDTAGLRDASESIERAGVERSVAQVEGADVVLWVEASDEPGAVRPSGVTAHVVCVESKRDRGARRSEWIGVATPDGGDACGIDDVRDALARWFRAGEDTAWIGLRRHRDRAAEAADAIADARARLEDDRGLELVAVALAEAQSRLGEITGRGAAGPIGAEVLDRIFARFCIGK